MFERTSILIALAALAMCGATVVACSDESATPAGSSGGNPLNPDSGNPIGVDAGSDSSTTADGGTCPNKPAGCFCGTPTTQKQFLNRCTNAAALPVTLTPKAATTADIP